MGGCGARNAVIERLCWPGAPLADPPTVRALVLANGFAAAEVWPACQRLQHPACAGGFQSFPIDDPGSVVQPAAMDKDSFKAE